MLARQGHHLIQIGVALFLLTSFWGVAIPALASPVLGRSAHTLAALEGVMFVALGLVWPRFQLAPVGSRLAFWLFIYSALAILLAFVLGALWGAGVETMPIAAHAAHGDAVEENAIRWIAYSSAPTGIAAFALMLWGLRLEPQ